MVAMEREVQTERLVHLKVPSGRALTLPAQTQSGVPTGTIVYLGSHQSRLVYPHLPPISCIASRPGADASEK